MRLRLSRSALAVAFLALVAPVLAQTETAEIGKAAQAAGLPAPKVKIVRFSGAPAVVPEPVRLMKYVDFVSRTGLMKNRPAAWTELFLPLIHDRQGS